MMRFIYLLFIFCIIYSLSCSSKNPVIRKGTCIVAAIGTDGIIIAADSRSINEYVLTKEIKTYSDSVEKIYVVKGYPIAFMGREEYDGKFLSDIVADYNSLRTPLSTCAQNLIDFATYMKTTYPISKYPFSEQNIFVSIGYMGKRPYLLLMSELDSGTHYSTLTYVSTDPNLTNFLDKRYTLSPCERLKDSIAKGMTDFFTTLPHQFCGGPISVMKIDTENKAEFIYNDFSKKPKGETITHKFE